MISIETLILSDGIELRPYVNTEGIVVGFWFRHPTPEAVWQVDPGFCTGTVPITGPRAWQVVQENPLTLAPSIHCVDHGTHGFVREGRWISA